MTKTKTFDHGVNSGTIPVCAIGASAGGVEALQTLFAALPDDLGFAYVVVVHLAPDQPSHLGDILAARTTMPVHAVDHARTLAADTVYVVAPDRALAIEGDEVVATPFVQPRCRRTPIDQLFHSAAAARIDAVAVVLSGASADGTLGARAIKAAGGIVLAQAPDEADYPTMPASVVAARSADVVAPLAELAQRVAELARTRAAVGAPAPGSAAPAAELAPIVELVNTRTGHDLSSYKKATLARRVARRVQVTRRPSLAAYADYLRDNPREARALFDDLMISVTAFFRDGGSFRVLAERAIGPIFDRLGAGDEVRAWVVGCATGEEAYSLAMLLLVEAERRGSSVPIQVFATDLDTRALAVAREGRYPRTSAAGLADAGLDRFFRVADEHIVVAKEVRDLVLFAEHDVLKDPPFLRLDLVACRNLMIYLERDAQQQLTALFRYALKPGGFLFLGSAETVEGDDLFDTVDRDARLYRAAAESTEALPALPQLSGVPALRLQRSATPAACERPARAASEAHFDALERAAPASALVDARHEILHLSPGAGRFFVPPAGPFSKDATALVRDELRVDLRRALNRAFEAGEATLTPPVALPLDGGPRRVALQVAPASGRADDAPRALIFFLDGGPADAAEPAADDAEDGDAALVRHLRAELDAADERLQTSRYEYHEAVQELRAANEELQSINEEYRSTSEELETSKEELQSVNEELRTVNAELRSKLERIAAANSDLQNLMRATDVATLFVDTGLRIRLFTPAITELFNITGGDAGRAITDFTHQLGDADLEADAARVLRDLAPLTREVAARDRYLTMRMRPYRTVDDRIDGLVVTFVDVTERRRSEEMLRWTRDQLALATTAAGFGWATWDVGADLLECDERAREVLDLDAATSRLADWAARVHPDDREAVEQAVAAAREKGGHFDKTYRLVRRDGDVRRIESSAMLQRDGTGRVVGASGLVRDVTDRRRAEETLRQTRDLLERATVASGLGWATCDLATGLARWDERSRRMIGLDAAETPLEAWLARVHPDDRAEVEAVFEHCASTGAVFDLTYRVVHRDGEVRRIQATGVFPREWDGTTGRASALLRDVTDDARAQAAEASRIAALEQRVSSTLAAATRLARRRAEGPDVAGEGFLAAFDRRLQALAAVHGVLERLGGAAVPVDELVRAVRPTFDGDGGERVVMEGPPLGVAGADAVTLAMLLHELGADAGARGALAAAEGRAELVWRGGPERGELVLDWRERGGGPADARRLEALRAELVREFPCRVEVEAGPEGAALRVALTLDAEAGAS